MSEEQKTLSTAWRVILISSLILSLSVNVWAFLCDPCDRNGKVSISYWVNSLFDSTSEQLVKIADSIKDSVTVFSDSLAGNTEVPSPEQESPASEPEASIPVENKPAPVHHRRHLASEEYNLKPTEQSYQATSVYQRLEKEEAFLSKSDSEYYVINGAFCNPTNVQRFFHSMEAKGYPAELLFYNNDKVSCKRVSVGKFKTRAKAEEYLVAVRSAETPNAWILAQHY